MLKLTNSFCRYLKLICEKVHFDKTHVKRITHLSCRKDSLSTRNKETITFPTSFIETGHKLRLLANVKKRLRLQRLPPNTNDEKKSDQMSESLQPTVNNVSYGGQFNINETDSDSGMEWQNGFSELQSLSNASERDKCLIPQDFRIWEPVTNTSNAIGGNAFRFKIISYNVLAQYLLECHPYLYTDCSPYNLKWKVRSPRLFNEIMSLAPDIICFQEVQASHLNGFYAKFEQAGYFGIFKQKTGHRMDGCAIYFKQSLFELKDHVSVEFYQPELPILNRDNIGMMVKLIPVGRPDLPIVIATTHLLYNPKRTDVRLAQIQVFLAEIDRFAYYDNGRETGYMPIVLTGDFNSTPESAVIKLLDRGCVKASPFRDASDWKKIGVTDSCQHLSIYLNRQMGLPTNFSMTKIYNSDYRPSAPDLNAAMEQSLPDYSQLFNSGTIAHSLQLTSAYDKYRQDGHYEATTFQDYWITVDYIYFSCCSNLRLLERLRLPTASECEVLGQLPNDVYGSDHLVLAAIFELKPLKSSL